MGSPLPDPASLVLAQLFPPGPKPADAIKVYDGAVKAKNGFDSWTAWDVRGPLLRLLWDLLRFQTIDTGKPNPDRAVPYGLRDTVTAIWYLEDQNNQLLRAIADAVHADTSSITGGVKSGAEASAHQASLVDSVRTHLIGEEDKLRTMGISAPGLLEQAGLSMVV